MQGVVPLIKMKSGCDYHRLVVPLHYMGITQESLAGKQLDDVIEDTKVLIFNRTIPGFSIEDILALKKKYNFKIVNDLDDYWELYPNHILYSYWYKNKLNEQIINSLKIADFVTVTTERLADKVKAINPNVEVIPNGLPYDDGQFTDKKIESEKTRFLYAGGSSHFWDIQCLKTPFQKTLNDSRFANSEFILAGVDRTNIDSTRFWDKMEMSFSLNNRLRGYSSRGTAPLEEYMNHYKECDVSLIPLEGYHFNQFKSNLKILEAGAKYIPVICSNTPPYSDFPRKDLLMLADNTREWFEHLKYCTQNPEFVKESGQALGEYCRGNFDIRKINEERKQLFTKLME